MAEEIFQTRKRLMIGKKTRPALPCYVRLHHDAVRARWVLLAPERIVEADDIAVEVLRLCDGDRTLDEIARALAGSYEAAPEKILSDIVDLLQNLADNGYIRDNSAYDAK